jgi:hypothetical protein
METTDRYKRLNDRRVVLCTDCSSRMTGVTIPSDEVKEHDRWHTRQRALELQAEGPDEFPFGYYMHLAETEEPRGTSIPF